MSASLGMAGLEVRTAPVAARVRVWPVLAAYVVVFAGNLLGGVVLLLVCAAAWFVKGAHRAPDIAQSVRGAGGLLLSADGLAGAGGASAAVLLATAAIGAGAAAEPASARLRLGPARVGAGTLAAMIAGVVAVSRAGGDVRLLAGAQNKGTLGLLSRVFSNGAPASLAVLTCGVVVVGPVAEEIFFRGFMQTRLRERWGPRAGVLIAAAAFGLLLHMDLWQGCIAFGVGLYLGWITELTGSIGPAIAAHVANNLIASLMGVFLRGPDSLPQASPRVTIGILVVATLVVLATALWVRRAFPEGMRRSAAPDAPAPGASRGAVLAGLGVLLVVCAGSAIWSVAGAWARAPGPRVPAARVTDLRVVTDDEGDRFVLGQIQNTGDTAIGLPAARIVFHDDGSTAIGNALCHSRVRVLEPGKSVTCKARVPGEIPASAGYEGKVEPLTSPPRGAITLVVTDAKLVERSEGTRVWLRGKVTNTGAVPAKQIKVVATFRGADGNVVWLASAKVAREDLEPGQSSQFSARLDAEAGASPTFEVRADAVTQKAPRP